MGTNGSESKGRLFRALESLAALAAAAAGVLAMQAAAVAAVPRLGMRGGLIVAEIVLCAPSLVFLFLVSRGTRDGGRGAWRLGTRGVLLSALAGVTLWCTSLGLLELQSLFWKPPAAYLDMFRRLHAALRPSGPADAVFSVLAIAVAPAVCEEIVFRGALLPSLARLLGAPLGLAGSALLFGLIHVDGLPDGTFAFFRVPFAIAIGIGLGLLRLRAGALAAPMFAHAVLNTITFAATPWVDAGADPTPDPLLGAGLLLFGSVSTVLVLRRFPHLTHVA